MPHNKNLEIPELAKNQDGTCTYTHNHAASYSYKCAKWTLATRKEARIFVEQGKREIRSCMFFMKNCLKDSSLTGVQQAILQQLIKNDKYLIESLSNAKPAPCTIL